MSNIENPPAFPVRGAVGYGKDGMTLRDYFAIRALPLCYPHYDTIKQAAESCYKVADAMLRARGQS